MATVTGGHRRRRLPTMRRAMLVLLLLVSPALAMEAGVRVLIAAGRLPVAPAHDAALGLTWMDFEAMPPPDVIVYGDSLAKQGIDPRVLAAGLRSPDRPVRVFNMSSAGARPGVNRALARQVEAEGRSPRVAIIGLSLITIRSDTTWTDQMAKTPMGRLFTDCAPASDLGAQIDCRVEQFSALWRWHGHLPEVYQSLRTGSPTQRRESGRELRHDGFRLNPSATEEELQGQLSEALDGEPIHVGFGEDAAANLVGMVHDLEAAGVTPVLVALPYSPILTDALIARNPAWSTERSETLAGLSELTGVAIIDPGELGPWWTPASSYDVKHLSAEGARDFTHQLLALPEFVKAVAGALSDGDGSQAPP